MANKTKKITDNPLLDLIVRLINVYLAATLFFAGLQYWSGGKFLLAIANFALVVSEIGLVFNWLNKDSKILRVLMFAALTTAVVCLVLSKIYN